METLQQPEQLDLAESTRHPLASPIVVTKQLGEPGHTTLCVALFIHEHLGKQQELQDKAPQKPSRLSSLVVKVSSVISILETGGYSIVQCLWTEKLGKACLLYD